MNSFTSVFGSRTFGSVWTDLKGHPSGFDYMRTFLAVSVLLWHSYGLSYGLPAADELWNSPAGYIVELILPMFFCLSGFLVAGSLERTPSLRKFLTLRAIRIYPALCMEVLLSAIILGAFVSTLPLGVYFSDGLFYSYILNTVGWVHYLLPGVFAQNPVVGIVNPSIWTVPYELECYIALSFLVLVGFLRSRKASLVMFGVATIFVTALIHFTGDAGVMPGRVNGRVLCLCFLAGAVIFRLRDLIPYDGKIALAAGLVTIIMVRFNKTVFFAPIFVAYLTAYLGTKNPRKNFIVNSGDYSYGLYLYAAPIQQTVVFILGAKNNWFVNVAIALPTTVMLALFSWYAVEKPFLKVKKLVIKSPAAVHKYRDANEKTGETST